MRKNLWTGFTGRTASLPILHNYKIKHETCRCPSRHARNINSGAVIRYKAKKIQKNFSLQDVCSLQAAVAIPLNFNELVFPVTL